MSRTRRERTPFSTSRRRLAVRFKDPDFHKKWHAHWLNDEEGVIERAQEDTYVFVTRDELAGGVGDKDVHSGNTDINSNVSRVVNGSRDGNPATRAYLMKKPIDDYNEDQAVKEERNRLVDKAIRAGKAGGANVENAYGDVRLS